MLKSPLLMSIIFLALVTAAVGECCIPSLAAASPKDRCANAEDTDEPMGQCCVAQTAENQPATPILVRPDVVGPSPSAEIDAITQIALEPSSEKIVRMPPGRQSLTHQICVLLI